jgi:hypothetical protein
LQRDIAADAGLLCDKAAVLGAAKQGTTFISEYYVQHSDHTQCSFCNFLTAKDRVSRLRMRKQISIPNAYYTYGNLRKKVTFF